MRDLVSLNIEFPDDWNVSGITGETNIKGGWGDYPLLRREKERGGLIEDGEGSHERRG